MEELKKSLGDAIRIIKIDIKIDNALSDTYRIQSVPTLILFKKGEIVWRHSGTISLGELKLTIIQYK